MTNTNVIPFSFEGAEVRVIDRDSEPWFVAADVCRVLEHTNPSVAISRLDDDEKGVNSMNTLGGPQKLAIINESGLYSLIMTSRKPTAKRLRKWVTSEVLPTIRKTGGYGAPIDPMKALNDPAAMRGLLLTYCEKVLTLEATVAEHAPTIAAYDRIASSDGSLCITDAAKALQVRPKVAFDWLRANGWIYSRIGRPSDVAYQEKIQVGYLEHKVTTVSRSDRTEKTVEQVRITPKGLAKLAKMVPGAYVPVNGSSHAVAELNSLTGLPASVITTTTPASGTCAAQFAFKTSAGTALTNAIAGHAYFSNVSGLAIAAATSGATLTNGDWLDTVAGKTAHFITSAVGALGVTVTAQRFSVWPGARAVGFWVSAHGDSGIGL